MQDYRNTLQAEEIRNLVGIAPLMVEIGCHEGSDTVRFLKAMPDILLFCFDCELRALHRFRSLIGRNSRVKLIEKAVADVDDVRFFHASTGKIGKHKDWDYSGSLCKPTGHLTRSPEIGFKSPEIVPCVRLDTWWKDVGEPSPIDFIWADVQGSQRLVIEGGRKTLSVTRYLYIEAHDPVAYANEPTQEELIEELSPWFEPISRYARENILLKRKEGTSK